METGNRKNEISFRELVSKITNLYLYLLSKWQIIILVVFFGGVVGILYSIFVKPRYTAECSFVLEDGDKAGGLGAYAGIASLVGLDVNVGGGLFQGENIFRLYQSRTMIVKTLLSKAKFSGKEQLLIERYVSSHQLDSRWKKNPDLEGFSFSIPLTRYGVKHDSLLTSIVEAINKKNLSIVKYDKKSSIINVSFTDTDEVFAKTFLELLVDNVNTFYVQAKTKKSLNNVRILQHQADSVRKSLNSAISGVALSVDNNPNANPALQILRVPAQTRSVDVQANTAILQELVKNLEISKVSLRRETPLIQVIDSPVYPLKKIEISKTKGGILGALIAGIFSVIFIMGQYFWKRLMEVVD